MKKIAIIGFGTIGKKLYEQICKEGLLEVAFVYDPKADVPDNVVLANSPTGKDFAKVDLVVETAIPQIVEDFGREIIKHTDFMPFSVTAFANRELYDDILYRASIHQHKLFIPHGAILGLDGIFDGSKIFDEIQITTAKNPKSLGRNDTMKKNHYTPKAVANSFSVSAKSVNCKLFFAMNF